MSLSLLAVAALVAGLTGTWSPCGFSMIETIGPPGHGGGLDDVAACVTLRSGALVGGVLTFGVLSCLGSLLHGADQRRLRSPPPSRCSRRWPKCAGCRSCLSYAASSPSTGAA